MKRVCFIIVAFASMVLVYFHASDAWAQGLEALANAPDAADSEVMKPNHVKLVPVVPVVSAAHTSVTATLPETSGASAYVLGANDSIKVSVYGEDDLSGTYTVDATGAISMPLIGAIALEGKDLRQVEAILEAKFSDGYLIDPDVSVEVTTYRPFFILGEVRSPGSYNYTNGTTVLKAVALAGGFTYRANKREVQVLKTKKNGSDLYENVPVDKAIGPGDIVLVKEKFF